MDKSNIKIRLKWLKGIVHKLGVKKVIDPALCMGMMLYIENLQGKLEEGKQLNKNELTDNINEIINAYKIVGDFLDKSILKPNNINYPSSRNEFINLIK